MRLASELAPFYLVDIGAASPYPTTLEGIQHKERCKSIMYDKFAFQSFFNNYG